jgi:hypothetical protein
MTQAQLISAIIGFCVAASILYLIRKDRMHVRHGLSWFTIAIALMLAGFVPTVIDELAKIFGVMYPPSLGFSIAIGLLILKILAMDIERTEQEVKIQRLAQQLAIIERELDSNRQH